MNFAFGIALVLVLASLCTEGHERDLKDNIDSLATKERQYRSLKDDAQTAGIKPKNATILERWENFENKLREGANAAIKMMLPYVMQGGGGMNISSRCTREAMLLIAGIKRIKPWAIKFLDSSAKMIDGMFEGTLSSLGVYDECLNIEAISEKSKDKGKVLFNGKYCTAQLRLPVPPKTRFYKLGNVLPELKNFSRGGTVVSEAAQFAELMHFLSFHMGLCVPSGCTVEDMNQVAVKIGEYVGLDTIVSRCEIKEDKVFNPIQIFVLSLFSLLTLLLVIGTMLGVYCYFSKTEFKSIPIRVLMSFNFMTNFEKFVDTDSSSDNLKCIHGFRFLTITWILLAHSYLNINHHVFLGMKKAEEFPKDFAFQAIINASVSVDSFYVMGGLLVSYLTMKLVKLGNHPFSIKLYVFHRLWRIMPTYVCTMLILLLGNHLGSGPVWHETTKRYIDGCYNNWWTNLIFINNFYDSINMCIPQSWYIASDFQLYIGALFILIPMLRSPRVGISICVAAIAACILYTGVGTYVQNLPYAMIFSHPDPDLLYDYLSKFYFKPFIHIGPYCIGILAGYLLATQPKLKIPPRIQVIGWSLAFITNFSVVYGIFEWNKGYEPAVMEGLLFSSLSRSVWSLGVAWVIVCCCTGHGGIVNYILSWKAFIPLGRLTFCVFLIHPIVQLVFMGNVRTLLQPDNMIGVYLFFGHLCLSYLFSFALCMLVESPTLAMEKVLRDCMKKTHDDTNNFKKNVVLNENLSTRNGDVVMIVPDMGNVRNVGVDNEAAVYKL